MKRDLPPLLALKSFDAAARHLSFTRAAAELCVTQGAVSRQIKHLEAHLGQLLFERLTRRIELTEFGRTYLKAVHNSFDLLEGARVGATRHKPELRLNVSQSFANLWLLPRVGGFVEQHKQIDVRIDTSSAPVDFSRDEANCAIRLGRLPGSAYDPKQPPLAHRMLSSWDGVIAEHLCDEILTPVISRELLAKKPPLASPIELNQFNFIHVSMRPTAWTDWFRARDLAMPAGTGVECGHFYLALEAARMQRGVALMPTIFLSGTSGRSHRSLATPFRSRIKSAGGYYLLYRERDIGDANIQTLKTWLLKEMGART